MSRQPIAWMAWLALLGCTRLALADGGVPILVVKAGDRSWTVLVRPARPVVGPIELDVLGPPESDAVLELREAEGAWESIPLEVGADAGVMHARVTLERSGTCDLRLRVRDSTASARACIEVSERPDAAMAHWPWILAWVPMIGLLWLRARALRARLYTAPHA